MSSFSPTSPQVLRQAAKVALQKELAEFQAELVELERLRANGGKPEDLKQALGQGGLEKRVGELAEQFKAFEKNYPPVKDVKPNLGEIQDQWKSLKEFSEPEGEGKKLSRPLKTPEALGKEIAKLKSEAKRNAAAAPLIAIAKCDSDKDRHETAHAGPCPKCKKLHSIPRTDEAIKAVEELHKSLKKDIDDEEGGTGSLTEKGKSAMKGGKMIGVLLCKDQEGKTVTIRAFSGNVDLNPGQDFWCMARPDLKELKSLNKTKRTLTEEDSIDNQAGNCAAQKLLRYVADYPESEEKLRAGAAKLLEESKRLLQQRLDDLRTLKDFVKEFGKKDLPDPKGLDRKVAEDAFDLIGAPKSGQLLDEKNANEKKVKEFVEARLKESVAALEKRIEDIKGAPLAKTLTPVGMAEMWIGEATEGDIPKQEGVLYDSCLTCRNTLGEVMCTNKD